MRGFVVEPRPQHGPRAPRPPALYGVGHGVPHVHQDTPPDAGVRDANALWQHAPYDPEAAVTEQLVAQGRAQLTTMDGGNVLLRDGVGGLNADLTGGEWANDGFPQQYPAMDVYLNNEEPLFHFSMPEFFPTGPMPDPLAEPFLQTTNPPNSDPGTPSFDRPLQGFAGDAEKHRRQASQDINPTASKRARAHDENRAPASLSQAGAKPRKRGAGGSRGKEKLSGEGRAVAEDQRADQTGEEVEVMTKLGREPGGHTDGEGKGKTQSKVKAPKEKAKERAKEKAKEKEKAVMDDGAESDSGGGGGGASRRWTREETSKLLQYILGPNAITDFPKFEKNPNMYCKRISRRGFNYSRSEEAVKARYMRMRNVFMNICTFENGTGNGSDPDLSVKRAPPNWKTMSIEDLNERFEKGRKAGKEYGQLTATVYRFWQTTGWYDLFMDKLSGHPNVSRSSAFCPEELSDDDDGAKLSLADDDFEDEPADEDQEWTGAETGSGPSTIKVPILIDWSSSEDEDAVPVTPAGSRRSKVTGTKPQKSPAVGSSSGARATPSSAAIPTSKRSGVPEPKHPGKNPKNQAAANDASTDAFLSASGTYLKSTEATNKEHLALAQKRFEADQARQTRQVALEERQLELQEKKYEREVATQEKRVQLEERQFDQADRLARYQRATEILKDPDMPAEVRAEATEAVRRYLRGTL